jgi:hypothetical protein
MPRSKIFLTIVLALLLINAIVFTAWYGFGLRNLFREMIASQLGKVMHGKVSIGELRLSDRQVFAQGVSFNSADSSLAFDMERLRIQYNLTSFIFSGFKLKRLIRDIDCYHPVVSYSYKQKPKPKQVKPKFVLILPDLKDYFKSIRIREGIAIIDIQFPLQIVSKGVFHVSEEFTSINFSAVNHGTTSIKLSAKGSKRGIVSANGILNKGRIADANIEIAALRPKLVAHPDIKNLRTEISVVASAGQDSLGSPLKFNAKAQVWGTEAIFASNYPVRIPYIGAETDGHNLSAQISRSTVGTSNIFADVKISNLGPKLHFDYAKADAGVDLAMVYPALTGFVKASLNGSGTIDEPTADLSVSTDKASYNQYAISNVVLNGTFRDGELQFQLPGAQFENQDVSIDGSFLLENLALNAHIHTAPINTVGQNYLANADIDVYAEFLDKYPLVRTSISGLTFSMGELQISGVSGYANLLPNGAENYFVDASLKSDNGYSIGVIGDLLDQNLLLNAKFADIQPHQIYANPYITKYQPRVSGAIQAIMQGKSVYSNFSLDLDVQEELSYQSHLEGVGSIDLGSLAASLYLDSSRGSLNGQLLNFSLGAAYKDKQINLHGLQVNDMLSLSGRMNLANWEDMDFSLALHNLSSRDIIGYYPPLDISLPDFSGLDVFANYNRNGMHVIDSTISLETIDLLAVTPLGLQLKIKGPLQRLSIAGEIRNAMQKLVSIEGTGSLKPEINLDIDAGFAGLRVEDVVLNSPVLGFMQGKAGITWRNVLSNKLDMDIRSDLHASDIAIGDFKIDRVILKATQTNSKLTVDTLYAYSSQLFEVTGSGAVDYNPITNEYFEGTSRLNLAVEGQLFKWLDNLTPYILESRGNSSLTCNIGTQDDHILLAGGKIEISDGYIRLQDQSEPITGISIKGIFDKNRVIIENGQLHMGNGKLVFNNIFESDNSDHFMLGYIDLGIFRVMIEEPGILANLPMFTPPNTLTNIILKGRGSRYATVKGPFDQMKITAEAEISSASVLYPPNTDNLLKLANTVRQATARHNENTPEPLPFTLDVMVTLGENVVYATYPTRLFMQPGGYLHLLYDGQDFKVQEAFFSSEKGTIDIFGTVFQVDKVDITMIDSQDLLSVDGTFFKRAPDGTMVTLSVSTSPDLTKSFADRLIFNLTSDNPEDRSISQILARLRYSGTKDPNAESQNGLLQDEALTLISGNLDSSLLTPFLSPAETFIRRKLKLDNFSISAGFIQNLYTQYSTDPNQLADYTDMRQFSSDVAQFSSSILLNNLSVSMSKYLGRSLFLDYDLKLQEATDLQKKTKLLISHETSIRIMLPKRYRMGYTFKYEPQDNQFTHEVMLQKSFRFWGL